jgi:hypothetical protein
VSSKEVASSSDWCRVDCSKGNGRKSQNGLKVHCVEFLLFLGGGNESALYEKDSPFSLDEGKWIAPHTHFENMDMTHGNVP